jgi:16S rRNA (uracil1498-N3)-methyltransferase
VLDGAGTERVCEVQDVGRDKVQLRVVQRNSAPLPPFRITLLQAVPKGKTIESIIQKATELGVHRLVPLLSDRAIPRLDNESVQQKTRKWQQVAVEAIKQCGSVWLPRIDSPITPESFLARQERFDLSLIASLQPGSRHAREHFREYQRKHGRKPESVCIWIGPEGDFTPEEISAIQQSGALPITLGQLVLRTDTATIYCLSILNHELQSD